VCRPDARLLPARRDPVAGLLPCDVRCRAGTGRLREPRHPAARDLLVGEAVGDDPVPPGAAGDEDLAPEVAGFDPRLGQPQFRPGVEALLLAAGDRIRNADGDRPTSHSSALPRFLPVRDGVCPLPGIYGRGIAVVHGFEETACGSPKGVAADHLQIKIRYRGYEIRVRGRPPNGRSIAVRFS
jgi:hypothetical protein